MKLILAIVHFEDAQNLVSVLTKANYKTTQLEGIGGFLKEKNALILVGTEEKNIEKVIEIIKTNCQARTEQIASIPQTTEPGGFIPPESAEITVGGATIFVIDVEQFKRI